MDRRIIDLYDEYTHRPLPRRTFLERLTALAGSSAAAMALLPLLENNYARAAIVAADDGRIETGSITFKGATGDVRAYLAIPRGGPAKRPGIVVIHENRGVTPHIQDIARRLAIDGFTALAVDMLSSQGGTPTNEDQAREMFAKVNVGEAVRDAVAAVAYLKSRPDSNGKVGAVGFCWGGGVTNLLAAAAPDLNAAVVFYGRVAPAAEVPKIKARLLLHYAGNDANINAGIADYEAALKAANVAYQKHMYDGAEHAFNNDTAGVRYNKAAADLAWSRTIAFFKANLS